jgi:hypothetical protein
MDTILEYKYYIQIYRVSYLILIALLYSLYNGHYNLAICPASIFLTSVHYWKKPDYSYRRYLDIVVVNTAFTYHHYMVYNAQYANIYYTVFLIAKILYLCGRYCDTKKLYLMGTYCHIGLHVLANIACIIVYSGRI